MRNHFQPRHKTLTVCTICSSKHVKSTRWVTSAHSGLKTLRVVCFFCAVANLINRVILPFRKQNAIDLFSCTSVNSKTFFVRNLD